MRWRSRGSIRTLGSAIGVVGGVIAGVAVSVGVLTAAWFANDASTQAVATALAGVGRASGATAAQLEQVAQSSAEAGKVSVSSARDMQVAFLATGKIGAEEMGRAIAVSRNLGVTLGVDTRQGAEVLARALADPLRGADELNDRIRFLDDRTRAYVRTLVDQNNRAEAQRVILNALAPSLADAEQAVNALGRAWQFVGRSASNAFDALGKAVDRAVDGRTPTEELELLRWQQERLRANVRGNVVPLMLPQVERRIAELERQLNDQQERARRIAAEARANEQSVRAGEIARDTNPGARHHAELVANGTPQVVVFLYDQNDRPVAAQRYRANAILVVAGATQRFALQPGDGNRLVGTAPVPVPAGTKGAVQITGPDGATAQARF